jgi:hypothetical protein
MSDKAADQKPRSPEGCDENGPAAVLINGSKRIPLYSAEIIQQVN